MKDLLDLKLLEKRLPVEKTIDLDGQTYNAHFLPLTRREFNEINSKPTPDDHLIYMTWVDEAGNKRLSSPDEAGDFPPIAYSKMATAALEVCGLGKKAVEEAKKD